MANRTRFLGDTRPSGAILRQSVRAPSDLSSATVAVSMYAADGIPKFENQPAVVHQSRTITLDAESSAIKHDGNDLISGDQIVLANTGGTLSPNLEASERYFVVTPQPNTFQVAEEPDGEPVIFGGESTGVTSYYVVGSADFYWEPSQVNTVGTFTLLWRETVGGKTRTYRETIEFKNPSSPS